MAKSPAAGLGARQAAFDILHQVLDLKKPLDQILASHRGLNGLTPSDRGLARWLVATTLRRLGQIDALWQSCLQRPLAKSAAPVTHILRLGVAQLLFMDVPVHAAVFTTVELCARNRLGAFKSLVNAVLRRLQQEGEGLITAQDEFILNTPAWLRQSWVETYGEDLARAIAQAHLAEPPLDITVKSDPETWAEKLGAAILPNGSLRLKTGGMITARDGFGDGAWWVQDLAATIPARLLGDVRGKTVIDLCAAPGGKTAQLCNQGAIVTAVDHSPKRLGRLQENLDRLQFTAALIEADILHWQPEALADHVLLDAPCSATGTIRRHPDLAQLKTPDDVARLATLQRQLLTRAATMVKPGGNLVYATCSLQAIEGPEAIAEFLDHNPHFRRWPITAAELPGMSDTINPNGEVRTLPCDLSDLGGMDGFFVCRLQRLS
jgi:16S rRNA (cytosine967-C5)-methyltransferase